MKRRLPRGRAGFSLLELIISLVLSTIVLIGVITMASQLLRNEALTLKSGEVSTQTAMALDEMNKELEQATYLVHPVGSENIISGCMNYSKALSNNGGINPFGYNGVAAGTASGNCTVAGVINCAVPVSSFYYCFASGSGTQGNLDSLLRYPAWGATVAGVSNVCPYNGGAAPACTVGDAASHDVIILKNVSHSPGHAAYFTRDNTIGGLDIDFVVGFATSVANGQGAGAAGFVGLSPAVAYYIDSKITLQKNQGGPD